MSFPEIVIWIAVSTFLVIRVAMLVAFVAMPVIIVRAIHRHSSV